MPRYKRILVIRLGAFGDLILSLAPIAALRVNHSDAKITLLTTRPFVELASKCPYFDDVWEIERWPWYRLVSWLGFFRRIRGGNFDCVYDLQRNDRTFIFRIFSPRRLRKTWFGEGPLPAAERQYALAISDFRAFPLPDLSWLDADISGFGIRPPFVLLVPGSSPQHPEKRWPVAQYAGLAQALVNKGYIPVALGTASETSSLQKLTDAVPPVVNLGGKTSMSEIAALARLAAGAVGNDTGPIHLIAMTGCPSLALYSGASNPEQSLPNGVNVRSIQSHHIADITVEAVYDSLSMFLRQ